MYIKINVIVVCDDIRDENGRTFPKDEHIVNIKKFEDKVYSKGVESLDIQVLPVTHEKALITRNKPHAHSHATDLWTEVI